MLQSKFSKLALCAASGALAATTAAGPALATAAPAAATAVPAAESPNAPGGGGGHKLYKGKVIAKTSLNVRSAPTRKAKIVGSLTPGQVVLIRCKVKSKDVIDGNPLWYRLANGNWAWASARYIKNIGEAPRWC